MNLRKATEKSLKSFANTLPILLSVILVISLLTTIVSPRNYVHWFAQAPLRDALTGSMLGSLLTGNPITSYVLGGALLDQGVGLVAVTSFILSWVTVGLVQLPAEAMMLGTRFAIARNALCFFMSIFVAVFVVFVLKVLG